MRVPTLAEPELLEQEAPGAGVAVPIAAPKDGPGYAVTADGVQDWVTGCTENDWAAQVEDHRAYTFRVAAVTRCPASVVPSELNCRNELVLFVPES